VCSLIQAELLLSSRDFTDLKNLALSYRNSDSFRNLHLESCILSLDSEVVEANI